MPCFMKISSGAPPPHTHARARAHTHTDADRKVVQKADFYSCNIRSKLKKKVQHAISTDSITDWSEEP
jgi:hypothetical protein